MARYPKPEGWNGGPDGSIQRQGSAGRLGLNLNTDEGEEHGTMDRSNVESFDESDLGGLHHGYPDPDD